MACSCMMRALRLPNNPVNRVLKERAPWVAHTSHCSGLQPWDTTWEVQWASRSQISTISSVHPAHGIPGQEHVYSTAVKVQYALAAGRVVGMGGQSAEQVSFTTRDIFEKG